MTPSESLDQSLKRMRLSYVDLYLVHQARLFKGKLHQGWRLFEELQKSGKTKAIGLSNFTLEELKELLENGEKPVEIQPAVLQNPLHLYNWHEEKPIVEYCHSKVRLGATDRFKLTKVTYRASSSKGIRPSPL